MCLVCLFVCAIQARPARPLASCYRCFDTSMQRQNHSHAPVWDEKDPAGKRESSMSPHPFAAMHYKSTGCKDASRVPMLTR